MSLTPKFRTSATVSEESLKQQIEDARKEVAVWTPERRANVQLEGPREYEVIDHAAKAERLERELAEARALVADLARLNNQHGETNVALRAKLTAIREMVEPVLERALMEVQTESRIYFSHAECAQIVKLTEAFK